MRVLKACVLAAGAVALVGSVSWGCFIVPECTGCSDAPTGGGGGGIHTTTSETTTSEPECTEDKDCKPEDDNPCTKPVCLGGACSEEKDDMLVPEGGTECLIYSCKNGMKEETPLGTSQGCGANPMQTFCDGMGFCKCEEKADCLSETTFDSECRTWECEQAPGDPQASKKCVPHDEPIGPLTDVVGDCKRQSCEADGVLVELLDERDVQDDGLECTTDSCRIVGMTSHENKPAGESCGDAPTCATATAAKAQDTCDGNGVCQAGAESNCGPYRCDPSTHECKTSCSMETQEDDCANGICEPGGCKSLPGTSCESGAECLSMLCTDGVCCFSPCEGPCSSCGTGNCIAIQKGVFGKCDQQNGAKVCSAAGTCVDLGNAKAVGQSCSNPAECFNFESGGFQECQGGLCRLQLDTPCEPQNYWYCSTKFCGKMGFCAECQSNDDCPGGECAEVNNFMRCRLGAGAPCGSNNDCASNNCDFGSPAVSPGTCQ